MIKSKLVFGFFTFLAIAIHYNVNAQNDSISVKNMSFNTENDHYGVSFFKDGELVVTSNKILSNGKIKKHNDSPLFILYKGKIEQEGDVVYCEPLKVDDKSTKFNVASSNFSPDNRFIYITTNFKPKGLQPNGTPKPNRLHIIRGEYLDGQSWGNFEVLPFCDEKYSYGQPSVSQDGKTLYFVSSMRGSSGRTDIYKVAILENNTYGGITKLSQAVNSRAKEYFPYESNDGYLYYSAKKKGGMGRLDIYRSKILKDSIYTDETLKTIKKISHSYGPSELLAAPINSPNDDYGIILSKDSKSGYFSSNRKGGRGGQDVYYFEIN